MTILDGKATAAKMRKQMAAEVAAALQNGDRPPALAVILVGHDPASEIYVRNKQKACAEVGIMSLPYLLPENTSQKELLDTIKELNSRDDVDGILLQLPLPAHLNAEECLLTINPDKDVDGFHPVNLGKLMAGIAGFEPCTPAGMIELVKQYGYSLAGKKAVVVGRSNIVGKPLAQMLAAKNINATVTLCHTGTKDLQKECLDADFLFLAMGKAQAVTGDMVSPGCVVVDAGINRTGQGLRGDADFESVSCKAEAITPVPGGIGPMTIAMLLRNTLKSWRHRQFAQN